MAKKKRHSEPQDVPLEDLKQGPIRHEKGLTPLLEEIARAIFSKVGHFVYPTFEQWELGFMRDMHPESEVTLWCSIAAAWLAYHEKYLNDKALPDEDERKLLGALIAISTGMEDMTKLKVPAEVGERLLQCYDDLRKE